MAQRQCRIRQLRRSPLSSIKRSRLRSNKRIPALLPKSEDLRRSSSPNPRGEHWEEKTPATERSGQALREGGRANRDHYSLSSSLIYRKLSFQDPGISRAANSA